MSIKPWRIRRHIQNSFQVDIEYEKSGRRYVTRLKANVNVRS
jgi:hypothetical protein